MKKVILLLLLFLIIPILAQASIEGTFDLNKDTIQLGDSFIFSGKLTEAEEPVELGFILVTFENEDTVYKSAATLTNGKFSVENTFALDPDDEPMPEGEYQISVIYNDGYGNTKGD